MPPENIFTGLSAHGSRSNGLEQFFDGPPALFAADAVELGEDAQVLLGAQVQVGGHRLRDDADGLAHLVRPSARCRTPLMRAVPEVGGTSVVSMRMSVDLPAPLGPSRPKTSPCSTVEAEVRPRR